MIVDYSGAIRLVEYLVDTRIRGSLIKLSRRKISEVVIQKNLCVSLLLTSNICLYMRGNNLQANC